MNQTDKRSIRFRLCEHKKNLLNIYEKIVVLLNGDLERLISEGKEEELSNGLIASVQALMNNVDFIYWIVNGKRYFATGETEQDDFENALDKAVREHVEGVRNEQNPDH